jgi:hypothetical protein
MSADPMGLGSADPADPQSMNAYAYVRNTPTSLVDPMGLCIPGVTLCSSTDYQVCPPGLIPHVIGLTQGGNGQFIMCADSSDINIFIEQNSIDAGILQLQQCGGGGCGPGGTGGGGFTLGIRAPGQTFNQCMVANSKNYSAGGVFALSTGTDVGTGTAGQLLAGNTFTGLYAAFAGSGSDAAAAAATSAPDLVNGGIGTAITYGRRTTSLISLNLAGKGGVPQALSSSSGGVSGFLGSASKALNLGLDASLKAAIDAGLGLAEAVGCTMHR